ncbi:hypothetical protein [Puia dinghuensis]|nr:hypothetical protein [Puia dinghuensis]
MIRARLYWHVFVTARTPAIVAEQLRFVRSQPFPVTAVITGVGEVGEDTDSIMNLLRACPLIDDVRTPDRREFEFDTMACLFREASNYDYVGYFHTKGATTDYAQAVFWRNLMNFYTVQLAENSIALLEAGGYDFIGAMSTTGLPGQKPYIAGNFWWARSSYIQRLPSPILSPHQTRYDCELWIGLGEGEMGAFLDMRILDTPIAGIVQRYDTDKKAHGYIPFYELYLSGFRFRRGRLLEIGVYKGESLRLWQQALPQFVVEGADIESKPELQATVYVGDQADRSFLSGLPQYDIIIDDGGHRTKQQLISLVSKIQHTNLYVIEDLHTSFPELYASYHEPGEITCLDYLRQYPSLKPDYISQEEHERLADRKIYIEEGTFSPIAFILPGA